MVYLEWINVYRSQEYRDLTMELIEIIDKLGEKRDDIERLKWIFRMSSRYEYMFWDMAYKMENWPV